MLGGADVVAIQNEVKRVRVDDSLIEYALAIVGKTRIGVSVIGRFSARNTDAVSRGAGTGICRRA